MPDHDPWGDAFVAVIFGYFTAVLISMALHGAGCDPCLDWIWWTTEKIGDMTEWLLTAVNRRGS